MTSRTLIALSLAAVAALHACAPAATEEELTQMCARLQVLRDEEPDPAARKRCVDEARREGISRRQARCRISAVNKQEYWNRCRTGEAR